MVKVREECVGEFVPCKSAPENIPLCLSATRVTVNEDERNQKRLFVEEFTVLLLNEKLQRSH